MIGEKDRRAPLGGDYANICRHRRRVPACRQQMQVGVRPQTFPDGLITRECPATFSGCGSRTKRISVREYHRGAER